MNVLVTGGAGYVGCVLVPKLLKKGYEVVVLDKMMYGRKGLLPIENSKKLRIVEGDIRNFSLVDSLTKNCDAIIHLASISNDPCSELNHELTKQVNYDAVLQLALSAKKNGVLRFVNVSSSSVYGIKEEENVTEDLPLNPLTIYSQTKAWTERAVHPLGNKKICICSIRSATVCGYSPRMRLDVVVNILTHLAVKKKKITVFGGSQKRPNINIEDITDCYIRMLDAPTEKVQGQSFNVGYENHTIMEIAEMVKDVVGKDVEINIQPTNDLRSYHISSEKIKRLIGFTPKKTIKDAVLDVRNALTDGRILNPDDVDYYNVKKMKDLGVDDESTLY